jgi:hypothetical protein
MEGRERERQERKQVATGHRDSKLELKEDHELLFPIECVSNLIMTEYLDQSISHFCYFDVFVVCN